jgi:purine-nucleoside phosphorylase
MSGDELPSAAAAFLRSRIGGVKPRAAVVLGSGLHALADDLTDPIRIAYRDIPGFPQSTVAGHAGELVFGRLGTVPVVVQSGRFHLYEGHAPRTVALPVRTFAALDVDTLIVTNAAGGLRPTFSPPLLMLIADHLNHMWRNPLLGPVGQGEDRFLDMSEPYDAALRRAAREAALAAGIGLEEGVYAGVLGPSYETPAEIRMLARMGVDAVGMSTVPEVIAARAGGMRVVGVSTITNLGAGISAARLRHEEVLAAGTRMSEDLRRLVSGVLGRL